jgi:FKBP-type peptidyl-prolyl cis-trans isomerase
MFVFPRTVELQPGKGSPKRAKINTPCKCHYAGTLIDGTEFDSSYKRGAVRMRVVNKKIIL